MKFTTNDKRLMILAVWGNVVGFFYMLTVFKQSHPFAPTDYLDIFRYFIFIVLMGLPGLYFSTNSNFEPNNKAKLSFGFVVECMWFSALSAFFLGIPGLVFGLVSR